MLQIAYGGDSDVTEKKMMVSVALQCALDAWTDYTFSEFKEAVETGNHGFCQWVANGDKPPKPSGAYIAKMRPLSHS